MRMTDVGVETFSVTLNNNDKMEKEQMSTPEPLMEVNIPPMKPKMTSTNPRHQLNEGILSNVLLL